MFFIIKPYVSIGAESFVQFSETGLFIMCNNLESQLSCSRQCLLAFCQACTGQSVCTLSSKATVKLWNATKMSTLRNTSESLIDDNCTSGKLLRLPKFSNPTFSYATHILDVSASPCSMQNYSQSTCVSELVTRLIKYSVYM